MNIRRRHRKFEVEAGTSSMNDIMFFLMLFFLLASTVLNPDVIEVLLPKATITQTLNKKQINVTISADLKYYVDGSETSKEALETTIQTAIANADEATIMLRADKSITVQDIVDVMQIGTKLKAKMVLATQAAQ